MRLEKELKLQELLKQWREERELSIKSQRNELIGNLCGEIAKYHKATNNDEKIDALCYIYVFCMNSLNGDLKDTRVDFIGKSFPRVYALNNSKLFLLAEIENKLNELKIEDIVLETFNLYLYIMMRNAEYETLNLGYNFYECILETIEEISSKTEKL